MKRRTPNPGVVGTRGDESLEAGIGLDVYAYRAGDGDDTICDTGDRGVLRYGFDGTSRVIVGAAIELSDAEWQSADGRFRFAISGTDPLVGITGDAGEEVLFGGAAADLLPGGDGDDVIVGGAGEDTLLEGEGNDRSGPLSGRTQGDVTIRSADGWKRIYLGHALHDIEPGAGNKQINVGAGI